MPQNPFVIVFALVMVSCAGQVPPSGGPPDTDPPTVIRTVPDSNAVRVEDNSVELEFSEYVDRRSVEESIFISPYVGSLDFDWGSTDVKVSFSEQLKRNTTYVVNIGTDVTDLRARNRMAAGHTLAFSTGDSIDQGLISGRVFDEKPEGIMIFAYALGNYNPDTLNPSTAKPDYIMQTGKNGYFTLSNLAFGNYRIIAVRDEYRNLLYDKQIDQYGVTVADTSIFPGHPIAADLYFRLSQEDTSRPFLTGVQPLSARHLQIRFSEPVDSVSFADVTFSIVDTVNQKAVPVSIASRSRTTPTRVDIVTQSLLDSGVVYRLTAQRVFDRAGNLIDAANSTLVFVGVATPDTMKAVPTVREITDSAKGIALESIFEIGFSEPVLQQPLTQGIRLLDSSRVAVPSSSQWLNATDVQIIPLAQLRTKAWYQIRIVMDSVEDFAGNRWRDSTWSVGFQSLDLRTTGVVEGVVFDSERGSGQIFVTAVRVGANTPQEKTITLPAPGNFTFDRLAEGLYTFRAFRDADSSGNYSFGMPYPFVPSERFTVSADTVKVRARWGVEGVALKFR